MPKIKDVLAQIQTSKEIPDVIKYIWLGQLDKKKYNYPEDADTELKMKNIEVYTTYLDAMIAFYSGDLAEYSAKALLFEWLYREEERRCRNDR